MSEFADFIRDYSCKNFGQLPLFEPGEYDDSAEEPFTPSDDPCPVDAETIRRAEDALNCRLPVGYCTFLETLGPGLWAGAGIPGPELLYALDQEVGSMSGCIPLAFNVNGQGDYLAFNPRDPRKFFFLGHDPFGYAEAATSFEDVIKKMTLCAISDPDNGVADYFQSLQPFHEEERPVLSSSKAWWQFWK